MNLVNQTDRQRHAAGRANAVRDRHYGEKSLLLDLSELVGHISGQFVLERLNRYIQLGQPRARHGRFLLSPSDRQLLKLNKMVDDSMH